MSVPSKDAYWVLGLCLGILLGVTSPAAGELGVELIVNGDFEQGYTRWSSGSSAYLIDDEYGKAAEITPDFTVDQSVTVEPGARYEFSWMRKTMNNKLGAIIVTEHPGDAAITIVSRYSASFWQGEADPRSIFLSDTGGAWLPEKMILEAKGNRLDISLRGGYGVIHRFDNVFLKKEVPRTEASSDAVSVTGGLVRQAEADSDILSSEPTRANARPLSIEEKKIIGFACDVMNTRFLRDYITELEQLPIDGLVINVYPDSGNPDGDLIGGYGIGRSQYWFGGQRFSRGEFQKAVAELKATKFTRFTDNFMDMPTIQRGLGTPDWFDDDWSRVAENARVAAYVAKEGGLKGFLIDVEAYGGATPVVWRRPFDYENYVRLSKAAGQEPHSFEECATQIRKRGMEFMEAVTAVYPDITIIMIPAMWGEEHFSMALVPAFVGGMLERIGKATLIDGGERGYPLLQHKSFLKLRQHAEKTGPEASGVPELYKRHIQYAFGVWVDLLSEAGWYTDPKDFEKNYRTPERLEHSLHNALTVADKYVWLFNIHPQAWWRPDAWGKNKALQMEFPPSWLDPLSPHAEIPKEYLTAIKNSRKPHDLNWTTEKVQRLEPLLHFEIKAITPEKVAGKKNLLKNGGFEEWSAGENKVDGWEISGHTGPAVVSREKTIVKEGSYSVKITKTKDSGSHIYVSQYLPAKDWAGKTITLAYWTKSSYEAMNVNNSVPAAAGILDWDYTGGTRPDEGAKIRTEYKTEEGWWFAGATKTIRKTATANIWISMDIAVPEMPDGGVVYIDGTVLVEEK